METPSEPKRCPSCHALVVDRRSPTCTTCRAVLPAEWIMTPQQKAKMTAIDKASRQSYVEGMETWDRIKSSSEYPLP